MELHEKTQSHESGAQTGKRPIHLLIYPSPIFPAHWAIWIPRLDSEHVGKIIQVEGDPSTGFEYEIHARHDLREVNRRYALIKLGEVDSRFVSDFDEDEDDITEERELDKVEELARFVPPPQTSLRSANAKPGVKVCIKNCQTWLRDFVQELVALDVLPETALRTVDEAPKN